MKNKFGNCADINEDGYIRIPATQPAEMLSEGRLLLQLIDTPDPGAFNRYCSWLQEVKGIPFVQSFLLLTRIKPTDEL